MAKRSVKRLARGTAIWAFTAVCGWGCRSHPGQQEHNPTAEIAIPFASQPPQIDGTLEEIWSRAAAGDLFLGDGRSPPQQSTRYRLLWNESALYFAFECQDPDISGKYHRRDEPLYLDEVVEIFLDPDADRQDYVEMEISPRNVLFDAAFSARRQGMNLDWNPPIVSAVAVDGTIDDHADRDRGYRVELALPFSALAGQGRIPPQAQDIWRMNLYRLDKSSGREEASMLRPAGGDFHNLDAFASIRFAVPP